MKTFKNLYPQVYAFENLYEAFRKARLGGKRKAVNGLPERIGADLIMESLEVLQW